MSQSERDARTRQLNRMKKGQLARLHATGGGLMGIPVYMTWTKDELVSAILEHEFRSPGCQLCRKIGHPLSEPCLP